MLLETSFFYNKMVIFLPQKKSLVQLIPLHCETPIQFPPCWHFLIGVTNNPPQFMLLVHCKKNNNFPFGSKY